MKRAVFLDRDGVINKPVVLDGHPFPPSSANEVEIFQGVEQSISKLKNDGFEIVVVTNQPDIARGKTDLKRVEEIHNLIQEKTNITNFYICAHDDIDNCDCRKPKIGLFLQAAFELDIDLKRSFMVGDRWKDIQAGQKAGCKCFFINYDYRELLPKPPYIDVKSIADVAKLIIGEN